MKTFYENSKSIRFGQTSCRKKFMLNKEKITKRFFKVHFGCLINDPTGASSDSMLGRAYCKTWYGTVVWYVVWYPIPYQIPYQMPIPNVLLPRMISESVASESKIQSDLIEALLLLYSSLFEDVSAISTKTL